MPTEPKTKPTDASVADFLDAVEHPGRREDGKAVAALMSEITGEKAVMWGPSIVGYGSYKGPTGDWPRIGFSPRKANLVLYMMTGFKGYDALLARLGAAPPAQAPRRRALVIDESIPDPGRDAGSSALLSHMRSLQRSSNPVFRANRIVKNMSGVLVQARAKKALACHCLSALESSMGVR